MRIGIIDYETSNLFSLQNAIKKVNFHSTLITKSEDIKNFDLIFLPGVGSFPESMKILKEKNMIDEIKSHVKMNKPLVGICLGFQLLFSKSYEFAETAGLNIINGEVLPLKDKIKITPNVGWLQIEIKKKSDYYKRVLYAYFVHSYYCEPEDENIIESYVNINNFRFCSSIQFKNIFGMQFHPEKSGFDGLKLLEAILKKQHAKRT